MKHALAVAAGVLLLAVVAQLADETTRLAGSNRIEPRVFAVFSEGPAHVCQADETLASGTDALRMTIGTFGQPGPPLDVRWLKGGRTIARAGLDAGWSEGVVRIPVEQAPSSSVAGVTVCFHARTEGRLGWAGEGTPRSQSATLNGDRQDGRVSLVGEMAGDRSMIDVFGRAADRYGAGNAAWLGAWTWWVIVVLVLAALAAAGAALWRGRHDDPRPVPVAGWLCALAAFLACTAWALLTPPFQVPDEISHIAYTQGLVESGDLPLESDDPAYSQQERDLLGALEFHGIIGRREARPPWSSAEEEKVRAAERAGADRDVTNASTASANPPLFYMLQAPVYWATPSGSLLDKVLPMRLLSALLGALTILAVFLFLRELLPSSPWLWPAGSLVAGLHPLFGFISGGVNPDALVFACAACLFWLAARILRRGATVRRVALLGGIVAAGLLTKPIFLGLVPAAAVAVAIAVIREGRRAGSARRALAIAGVAAACVLLPVAAYDLIGRAAFDHPYFAEGRTVSGTVAAEAGSVRDELSFLWQLWLPRLPGQFDQFPDAFPLRDRWLNGFVGQFGWLDYAFPPEVRPWVERLGLALLAAALLSLVLARRALRRRWVELAVYVVGVVGLAAAIGTQDYSSSKNGGVRFDQARYLLPLLALYGGLIAVALRPAGRRAGPYLGVVLVTLAAVHGVSGLILTVGRYYV